MKQFPIALQVYSIRDQAEADFKGTMQALKEMGYSGVELAGTYGMTAVQIKEILDEVGLTLVSAHVGADLMWDDALLADYAATGPSAVILEPEKTKSVTLSIVFPSICHEMMRPDDMILVF